MYLAICRSPLLHVFDLEEDSFEKITADLHAMKLVVFFCQNGFFVDKSQVR
jgi:hypothetical protein